MKYVITMMLMFSAKLLNLRGIFRNTVETLYACKKFCLCCPSQHYFFSHVETEPPLPGHYQFFSGSKCVFAQEHNTAEVGIEPRPLAPESETLPLGHRAPRMQKLV